MASIDDPIVPENCENFGATNTQFDECNEVYVFGPMRGMLTSRAPLAADPGTPTGFAAAVTEIAERLALPDADPQAMRLLRPILASMPAVTPTFIEVDGKQIAQPTLRNFPVTISQLNDKNYEFIRTANVGRSGRYWLLHESYMYGGQEGIGGALASLQLSNVVTDQSTGLHTGTGNLSYTGLYDPRRTAAPL